MKCRCCGGPLVVGEFMAVGGAETEDRPDVCSVCIEYCRELYRCPDCRSTVTVYCVVGSDGLAVEVAHSDTCPVQAREQRQKSRPPVDSGFGLLFDILEGKDGPAT